MSDHTSLCSTCKFLDGDECGPSCPKQPAGLPFQERIKKCKYYEQVKICPLLNKPCLLDMDCLKHLQWQNPPFLKDEVDQQLLEILEERKRRKLLNLVQSQKAVDSTEKIQKQLLKIAKELIETKGVKKNESINKINRKDH